MDRRRGGHVEEAVDEVEDEVEDDELGEVGMKSKDGKFTEQRKARLFETRWGAEKEGEKRQHPQRSARGRKVDAKPASAWVRGEDSR